MAQPGQCNGSLYVVHHLSHFHCNRKRGGLWHLRILERLGSAHKLHDLHRMYVPVVVRLEL